MRTIPVDHRDLDSVQEAKGEIERQIKAILRKKPEEIESPISVSVELQALRHSDNPEERSLAEFVSAVADLRTDIAAVEKRLSSPESLLPPSYIANIIDAVTRRGPRDSDVLHEMMFRLDRLMHQSEQGKTPSKELQSEFARLRDMLTFALRERG